ncbi:hypothetical protein Tco_0719186 [Tanacetum coccineum]
MRIEPTVPQKEETFQVALNIIKASPCFKAFTITAHVPEIYMQKFYFLNEDFVAPESKEDLLTFLIELGYKGPLDHISRMFVDHMHQPWRTLAIIINKCLSGKTSSNDRLRLSRVAILWGMFYWENVDYPKYQAYKSLPDSTGLIHSKKSRCKGSQGKNSAVTPKPASVEVSDESDPEPTNRPTSRRNHLPQVGGSSEGTSVSPVVLDESTVILTTSSEGTGTVPGVPNEANGAFKAKADSAIDWGSENKSDYSKEDKVDEEIEWLTTDEEEEKQDDQDDDDDISNDIEETDDDKKTDDEFVHGDEYVHNDVDEEMKDVEVVVTRKDDDEGSDAAKVKTEEVKGDNKKADLPPTSSSLFVSSGFDLSHCLRMKKAWIKEFLTYSRRKDSMMIKMKTLQLDQTMVRRAKGEEQKNLSHPRSHLHLKVIRDAANDNVVNDADQPQDDSEPKTDTTPRNNCFTQPPRLPTLDPEWNKGKEIFDGQDQTWFNDLLSAKKDPLTFDELMATPIDFSKFVMNRLKIDKLTKVRLVGPVYNLLKGTCQSSIELEYNIEECYKKGPLSTNWN